MPLIGWVSGAESHPYEFNESNGVPIACGNAALTTPFDKLRASPLRERFFDDWLVDHSLYGLSLLDVQVFKLRTTY
jgi:hypothetical protein